MNFALGMLLLMPSPQSIEETEHLAQRACAVVEKNVDAEMRRPPETKVDLRKGIVIRAFDPFCSGWKVVTVYQRGEKLGMSWIFQKVEESGYAPRNRRTVSWASSNSCQVIFDLIEELSSLKFDVGVSGEVRPSEDYSQVLPPPMMDGTWYTIYGSGYYIQPSLRSASISISSNDGEIAEWSRKAISLDNRCWESTLSN